MDSKGMTDLADSPDPSSSLELAEESLDALHSRYKALNTARKQIEQEIREILQDIREITRTPSRPFWCCRRCGYEWRGYVINRPPSACPRCHNANWQTDPVKDRGRRPTDPPNPRWGVRRPKPPRIPERVEPEPPPPMHLGKPKPKMDELTPPPKVADVIPSVPKLVPPINIRLDEES